MTGTGVTIRGWAITIWLALLGIAFSQGHWELGLLAAAVALVFSVIDGYHAWLYGEALARANQLERLSAAYYDSFGRLADDEEAATDLQVDLEAHRFGLYRNFKRFRLRDLAFVRPTVFFRLFYPLLFAVAVGVAALVAFTGDDEPPACNVVADSRPQAIECGDTLVVNGRRVEIQPQAERRR